MFQKTDDQQSLAGPQAWFPEAKRKRLAESWAGTFREVVVEMIDEEAFASLYDEHQGAPCKSVRAKICLLLFRELFNLTDRQTLEQYEWNLQWHYAIGIRPEKAHLTRKSLYNFRQKLMDSGKAQEVFEAIVEGVIGAVELEVSTQRQDSTAVVSNVRKMSRLELFVETIEAFVRECKREVPEAFETLPDRLKERYGKADGAFADVEAARTRRTLQECAEDLGAMVAHVEQTQMGLDKLEHWEHVWRLFEEQCERVEVSDREEGDDESPTEREDEDDGEEGSGSGGSGSATPQGGGGEGETIELRPTKEISSDSMQTPHDAGLEYHGRYGTCYLLQVVETSDEGNPFEVVTEVECEGGASSDQNAVMPTLERLEARGMAPEKLLVDKGYTGGENLLEAASRGTQLWGPVKEGSGRKEELLDRADFRFGPRKDSPIPVIEACPQGHRSVGENWTETDKGQFVHTRFDRQTCEQCPVNKQCPVMRQEMLRDEREGREPRGRTTNPSLRLSARKLMVAHRRSRQREEDFQETYRFRAGCEATNSEMKRAHGLSDLTIRGKKRVEFDVYFKAAATNIKRLLKAVQTETIVPIAQEKGRNGGAIGAFLAFWCRLIGLWIQWTASRADRRQDTVQSSGSGPISRSLQINGGTLAMG